jgi:4-diphosphocytidyl-2-C-methyl-D-erythritol kinase
MQLRAPAKINLSFKIHGRRADGFHEVETLVAPVSLYDCLTLTLEGAAGEVEFVCDDPALPAGDDNLVTQAARLFLNMTKVQTGLKIALAKKIPHGAGLGGGSSDAATTLVGLNQLLGTGLPNEALAKLGAQLGSDVPFFVFGSAAVCRGRGESCTPLTLPKNLRLLLLKPAFGVPTPWAYARWMDSRELPGIPYGSQEFGGFTLVNDLERPVFEKHVFLARMKMWLLDQSEVGAAMLSGSGSTVFAMLREQADAAALTTRAMTELDPELWACACETL